MPASLDHELRSQRSRIASYASWKNTPDRSARTKPGRDKFDARFEAVVRAEHPDWTDEQIARAAEAAKSEYFARLAFLSAKARKGRAA